MNGICFLWPLCWSVSSTFAAGDLPVWRWRWGLWALARVHQHRPSVWWGNRLLLSLECMESLDDSNFICPSLPAPLPGLLKNHTALFVGSPVPVVHILVQRRENRNSRWLRSFPVQAGGLAADACLPTLPVSIILPPGLQFWACLLLQLPVYSFSPPDFLSLLLL